MPALRRSRTGRRQEQQQRDHHPQKYVDPVVAERVLLARPAIRRRFSPSSSSNWLAVSATEWMASASMAPEARVRRRAELGHRDAGVRAEGEVDRLRAVGAAMIASQAPGRRRWRRSAADAAMLACRAGNGRPSKCRTSSLRAPAGIRRWPSACGRARSTKSSASRICSGAGKPLRVAFESKRPHSMILWGPPGRRQDHARAPDGRCVRARLHRDLRGPGGREGHPRRGRARAGEPGAVAARHGRVRRRGAPLQQGPAGRVPAARRVRTVHLHRRHDRESRRSKSSARCCRAPPCTCWSR